jgi:hypothetical protein
MAIRLHFRLLACRFKGVTGSGATREQVVTLHFSKRKGATDDGFVELR